MLMVRHSMGSFIQFLLLILIASPVRKGKVYDVGDEVELPCEEVPPRNIVSVKFFKARIARQFYQIDKYAVDLVFKTNSRKYTGELSQSSPHLMIHNIQQDDASNYTCQICTNTGEIFNKSTSIHIKCDTTHLLIESLITSFKMVQLYQC